MKPGEKYIIEIESVSKTSKGDIAFIKGFNTLVFDQNGLDRLRRAETISDAYKRGWDDSRAKLPSAQAAIDDAYKRGWNECAEKIQNIKDAAYQNGLDDAWNIARLICMRPCDGGMGVDSMEKVFGSTIVATVFHVNTSIVNVIGKIRAWEKEKAEIHIGDEVKFKLSGVKIVVTRIEGELISGLSSDGCLFVNKRSCNWEKTGRHLDVENLLKQMKDPTVGAGAYPQSTQPGGTYE